MSYWLFDFHSAGSVFAVTGLVSAFDSTPAPIALLIPLRVVLREISTLFLSRHDGTGQG